MAKEHAAWPPGNAGSPFRPGSTAALGAALRRAREDAGLTLDALAAATAISKPYLSNIETGRLVGPASEAKLRAIARVLDLPQSDVLLAADWLRTPAAIRMLIEQDPAHPIPRRGDGAIDLDALWEKRPHARRKPAPSADPPDGGMMPVRQIPLINRVAAGKPAGFGDMDYPRGIGDAYVPAPAPSAPTAESPDLPPEIPACAFALKVIGDSMSPPYREGEILFVAGGEGTIEDGADCVVRLGEADDYATTFKRIYWTRDDAGEATGIRLVPLNPAHAEWTVPLERISAVYRVVYRLVPVPRGEDAPAPAKVSPFRSGISLEHD